MNEVLVIVVTTLAFSLHLRLLQLNWSTKSARVTERKLLRVLFPLYATGALVSIYMAWGIPSPIYVGLKHFAGLIQDGFLLPQILLNIFADSKEKALSNYFYIGISTIRLLPHVYDINYRIHINFPSKRFRVYYMMETMEFDLLYSIAWDFLISLGGLVLVVIIYCQQRFGGRCVIPKRFRSWQVYEKLATVEDEEFNLT